MAIKINLRYIFNIKQEGIRLIIANIVGVSRKRIYIYNISKYWQLIKEVRNYV
mgnify:CR=1 FL=1